MVVRAEGLSIAVRRDMRRSGAALPLGRSRQKHAYLERSGACALMPIQYCIVAAGGMMVPAGGALYSAR